MDHFALPAPSSLTASLRHLRHNIPGAIRGVLRRQSEILLPNREAREYQAWITQRLIQRRLLYTEPIEPGLLCVLTPVWNGSPAAYLKTLAKSLIEQNANGNCEWFILDNGCTHSHLLSVLRELSAYTWIRVLRAENNIGIARGLRCCLQNARSRYVLPVDADDWLYPDSFQVVASWLYREEYPAVLYSDEDKVIGSRFFQPYLKPEWDPVLALNSAYMAHLQVIDRAIALELGAYSDTATEGSPDWDVFIRFMIAGYKPVHVPEVLYSWRAHAHSTADDAAYKPYVHSSQKAVLQRFLNAQPQSEKFSIEYSPLLGGAAHWHFSRRHIDPRPLASITLGSGSNEGSGTTYTGDYPVTNRVRLSLATRVHDVTSLAREMAAVGGLLHFIGEDVEIDDESSRCDWCWEAVTLLELYPDVVVIGGRIRDAKGTITEGGRYFGYGGVCGCPNRGRSFLDPGYFTQMWKQRSVSAVSTQFAVVDARFVLQALPHIPEQASFAFLGAWLGAHAARSGKRVVYSPFLSGFSKLDWESMFMASEKKLFAELHKTLIPDRRFYSRHLRLDKPFALRQDEAASGA